MGQSSGIIKRIESQSGLRGLADTLSEKLSRSDLNALLVEVFQRRARNDHPAELLKRYPSNHFTAPSPLDPLLYHRLEMDMLEQAARNEITPVLLSPVAPLGSSSVFKTVSQNKVISAIRGVEVVSDATNMLAIYIAQRLKEGSLDNRRHLHFCCTHRLVRVQPAYKPGQFSHFGLFSMVSSGLDTGSYAFELEALGKQLCFYRDYFRQRYGITITVALNKRAGYPDGDGFFSRAIEYLREKCGDIRFEVDRSPKQSAYYTGLQAKVMVPVGETPGEVGDLGFVDWTRQLLGEKRQRLLISAVSLERQFSLG